MITGTFLLNHDELLADTRGAKLAGPLNEQTQIDSTESFNHYCRTAIRSWSKDVSDADDKPSARFKELYHLIGNHADNTIPTIWGGVVVTQHEHPLVEKYLVIRRGGYLALEKHDEKDEVIEVVEGAGMLLSRTTDGPSLTVEILKSGRQYHFEPGREHCLIGTDNLLIFERSTDPKGMDQDLIFLYEPDGAPL